MKNIHNQLFYMYLIPVDAKKYMFPHLKLCRVFQFSIECRTLLDDLYPKLELVHFLFDIIPILFKYRIEQILEIE